jgi:DNA-binding Lrp family transcriptional regulator
VKDRRRVRGSHRGLKQMLAEGTTSEMPQSWRNFSGAMVRLAINDALNALPKDQTHVVWLAYFGGLSNSEIARRLGLSVGGVQRRLKVAFERMSEYVEHGRTAGRRALLALLGWLSFRWLADAHHLGVNGTVVAVNVAAVVVIGVTAQPVATPAMHPGTITHQGAAAAVPANAPSPDGTTRNDTVARAVDSTVSNVGGKTGVGQIAVPSVPPVPPVPPLPSPLPSPPTLP